MWRWAVAVPLTSILAPYTIVAILEIAGLLRRHQFDLVDLKSFSEIALYVSVIVLGGLILFALPLTYLLGLMGGRLTLIRPKWMVTSLATVVGMGVGAICGRVMVLVLGPVLIRAHYLPDVIRMDDLAFGAFFGAVVGASAGLWWALFASWRMRRDAAANEAA